MDSIKALDKLTDYAKGIKTWEEIVTPSTGENYSYSIEENGNVVAIFGDGDVTHYSAKMAIDTITEPLCGLSVLERKIEKIYYFFFDKVDLKIVKLVANGK